MHGKDQGHMTPEKPEVLAPNSDAEIERRIAESNEKVAKFQPTFHHDVYGDTMEFLLNPESFFAETIDDFLTVYYGQHSKDVVGWLFKKVKRNFRILLKQAPGVKRDIRNHRIK